MRNFKKFLALVLAMLMVSACAVSVSAAYADQDAVRATGYETAVNVLSDLKVISGTDAGEFNPNGTLTRAAAAKMASLLKAGSNGQKIEWKSTTSYFDDVDPAHWGNAYINYAFQNGLMEGTGEGFKPDATLSVAEAIVIAVKTAGLKAQVAELEKIATASYWAASWISVADTYSLTYGINVFDYAAPCTRAQFAQIAYNVLLRIPAIRNGFGNDFYIDTITTQITSVKDNKVTLGWGWKVIDLATFEATLDANGIEQSAEELKGVMLKVMISKNTLYSVEIASDVAAFTYADGKIENMYQDNNPNKALLNTIKIDGVVYTVGENDSSDDQSVIGSTAVVNGIRVYVDGENNQWLDPDRRYGWLDEEETNWGVISDGDQIAARTLPTYYKAVAYDDDADGEYDRLMIDTYEIATVKFEKTNSKGVDLYTISTGFDNKEAKADDEKPITWTGVDVVADNETPMLVSTVKAKNEAGSAWVIDVLEVADTVSGKVLGLSTASKYISLDDGQKYYYTKTGAADPANWVLQQNISIFTIGGQYVKVTTASSSYIEVVVNSAVVTDGKVVLTGYNKSDAYADITLTVDGIQSNGKLVAISGKQNTKTATDGKTINTNVELGYYNGDTWVNAYAETDNAYTVDEGDIFKITKTANGNYVTGTNGNIATIGSGAYEPNNFEVKNGYVYLNKIASKYFADDAVVLEQVVDAKADADTYGYITYNKLSAFSVRKNVSYRYVTDSNNANKYTFIFVASSNAASTTSEAKAIAEGQSIVYIANAGVVEATFDKFIFNAIDLMSGEKVTVTHTNYVAQGNYYLVKDGAIVAEATDLKKDDDISGEWIGAYKVDVNFATGSLIGEIKAQPVVATYDSVTKTTTYEQQGDFVTYGLDKITVYKAGVIDADGNVLKVAADEVAETIMPTTTSYSFNVAGGTAADIYVVAGQMIIVLK